MTEQTCVRANDAEMPSWNPVGHFKTITAHKLLVMQLCFRVGLYRQGLLHDLSKYSPREFLVGARYYQGTRSPNAAEREHKGYSDAWLHHKGRNRHHFEYWIDVASKRLPSGNPEGRVQGQGFEFIGSPMPTAYVIEMFCDRVAASRIYQGERYTRQSPLDYYLRECGSDAFVIHPDTRALLECLLVMLADEGEQATFDFIRDRIVAKRLVYGEGGRFR